MSLFSAIGTLLKKVFLGEPEKEPEVFTSRKEQVRPPLKRQQTSSSIASSRYPSIKADDGKEKNEPKSKVSDLTKDPLHERIMHYWMLLEMAKQIDQPSRPPLSISFGYGSIRETRRVEALEKFCPRMIDEWKKKYDEYQKLKEAYEKKKIRGQSSKGGSNKKGSSMAPPLEPVISYVVYYGLVRHYDLLKELYEERELVLDDDDEQSIMLQMTICFKGKMNGSKQLFSLKADSVQISPFIYLLSEKNVEALKSGKPARLFEAIRKANALEKEFECSLSPELSEEEDAPDEVTFTLDEIDKYGRVLLRELFLDGHINDRMRYLALKRDDGKGSSAITESFYNEDLREALFRLSGEDDCLIKDYMRSITSPASIKEQWYDDKHIMEWLEPQRYPFCVWPSPFSPALMQQVAINIACNKSPLVPRIFSVNGPPGTGKTTLLKDIIADQIYERAMLVSKYYSRLVKKDEDHRVRYHVSWDPFLYNSYQEHRKAFPNNEPIGGDCTCYRLDGGRFLRATSILVASSNNTAVENITKELPQKDSVPEEFHRYMEEIGLDYFSSEATRLISYDKDGPDVPAWGLVAVPLGKSANKEAFVKQCLKPILNRYDVYDRDKELERLSEMFREQDMKVYQLMKEVSETPLSLSDVGAQLKNPISDPTLNRERQKLMALSLALLKAFVLSDRMQENMELLLYYFSGAISMNALSYEEREQLMQTIFDTLFFLVPVVSTTFASVERFLDALGPGSIGYLVVDEAGQTAPQFALGALMRASRAIVVGDPHQVEPVIDSNPMLMDYLLRVFDLDKIRLLQKESSVQSVADNQNPYGQYLGEESPQNWVGCPLKVHRRCMNPMFSISNIISYQNSMVLGREDSLKWEEKNRFLLRRSCWIDMEEGTSGPSKSSHHIKEQAEFVLKMIRRWEFLHRGDKDGERPRLFVISPFKSVVNGMKRTLRQEEDGKELLARWSNHIGTVHTFQGKEADEVIFLLGCRDSEKRAIRWVNANILNVALTRAKKRVYIVGNQRSWIENNRVFALMPMFGLDGRVMGMGNKEMEPNGLFELYTFSLSRALSHLCFSRVDIRKETDDVLRVTLHRTSENGREEMLPYMATYPENGAIIARMVNPFTVRFKETTWVVGACPREELQDVKPILEAFAQFRRRPENKDLKVDRLFDYFFDNHPDMEAPFFSFIDECKYAEYAFREWYTWNMQRKA